MIVIRARSGPEITTHRQRRPSAAEEGRLRAGNHRGPPPLPWESVGMDARGAGGIAAGMDQRGVEEQRTAWVRVRGER